MFDKDDGGSAMQGMFTLSPVEWLKSEDSLFAYDLASGVYSIADDMLEVRKESAPDIDVVSKG